MSERRLSRSVLALVSCSALAALWTVLKWSTTIDEYLHILFMSGGLGNISASDYFGYVKWFLVGACCALALWSHRRGRGRPTPPALPGALPLIGNAHQFLGDETHMWNYLKNGSSYCLKKGGVISMRLGLFSVYGITDPGDCLTVANACLGKPYPYSFAKKWFRNGLITADEKTWKLHRKLLTPTFSQKMLNSFENVFNDQSRALVNQLRDHVGRGFFDPEPYLLHNILEIVWQTSLSMKPEENNTLCYENYCTASKKLMDIMLLRLQQIWLHIPFLYNLSSLKKRFDRHLKTVTDVTREIIRKRKLELHEMDVLNMAKYEKTDKCKTQLDLLLHLAAEQGVFTDSDIMDHLNTFIVASYDTTESSLLFTLVLLGTHQHVQERVYREIQEVLGDTEGNIDRHVLTKLVYLDAVVKESLRLYPPVPLVGRTIKEYIQLTNYTLPAGAIATLSIYGVNRHPMWGADAEQFRPERWLEPGGVPDNHNAFASFSLGRRNCIGKQFALLTIKTTLAHLLRRYRITADASKLKMKWDMVLKPISGHHISVVLRT